MFWMWKYVRYVVRDRKRGLDLTCESKNTKLEFRVLGNISNSNVGKSYKRVAVLKEFGWPK